MQHRGGYCAFEAPDRDARCANVFWRPAVCRSILSVIATPQDFQGLITPLPLAGIACQITIIDDNNGRHHILFTQDGRMLQLEIHGPINLTSLQLMTDAIPPRNQTHWRLHAIKRLADLAEHRMLRTSLYPPDSRGSRLARVLQALDGWFAGATQHEIAHALFGQRRADRDWNDPADHLRDQTRRAIARGRALMNRGYLGLLK